MSWNMSLRSQLWRLFHRFTVMYTLLTFLFANWALSLLSLPPESWYFCDDYQTRYPSGNLRCVVVIPLKFGRWSLASTNIGTIKVGEAPKGHVPHFTHTTFYTSNSSSFSLQNTLLCYCTVRTDHIPDLL